MSAIADGATTDHHHEDLVQSNFEGPTSMSDEVPGRAIPFITVDMEGDVPGPFRVTEEAKEALSKMEGPLAIG
jgi:hypothetical protein